MSDARDILDKVANGEMTPEEAELQLKMKPFVDLGFAKPDLHRGLRQGVPRRKSLSFRLLSNTMMSHASALQERFLSLPQKAR